MAFVLEHKTQPRPAPPKPLHLWNGERLAGNAILAFWLVSFLFVIWWLAAEWDTDFFNTYLPRYISGVGITLGLVILSLLLGALISVPIAFMRMSKNKFLSKFAFGYIYFFRGTPLITQLFLVYYGFGSFRTELDSVGLWGFFRDAWYCALFSFSLNSAAYQAEILRGAIESVPKGQWEGAKALGLSRAHIYLKIITPQALLVALRPYGNEIILMLKASAIVSIVTVFDLMGETRRAFSKTFDFQTYIYAAILYLLIVEALRNFINFIEKRIAKHLKR